MGRYDGIRILRHKSSLILAFWAILVGGLALLGMTEPAGAQIIVDEPEGPRTNHGGSLWHYRRNPELIKEFHAYLTKQGLVPEDLLPVEVLKPPATMVRMLIEPEELTLLPSGTWHIAQLEGASAGGGLVAKSGGTGQYVPLLIAPPRAGSYRLWVRYYAYAASAGVIGLRVYPIGQEEPLPILNVLANEWVAKEGGWRWASFLVDLPAEPVELQIVHEYVGHEAPGYRSVRWLDCIYLTTECWREAPSLEELAEVHKAGPVQSWPVVESATGDQTAGPAYQFRRTRSQVVRVQEVPFGQDEQDKQAWARWMARPADWELMNRYPKLFELSLRFWRKKVVDLAKVSHNPLPDYRDLSRQVIFDEQWNLLGNPVMIAKQVRQIVDSYPQKRGKDYIYHWLEAEEFQQLGQGWLQSDRPGNSQGCLRPVDDEVKATTSQRIRLDRAGRYAVWMRTGILGDGYSPLQVVVSRDGRQLASKDLIDPDSPVDSGSDWTWQKIGVVKAGKEEELQIEITSIPKSAVSPNISPAKAPSEESDPNFFYRWIEAENMENIAFDWDVRDRSGNSGEKCVGMGVDATGGAGYTGQEIAVDRPGEYYVWVRKGIQSNTNSPLRIIMLSPDYGPPEKRTSLRQWWEQRKGEDNQADLARGTMVQYHLDRNDYQTDPPGNWTWQRVGPLKVEKPGNIRVEVFRHHYIDQKLPLTPEIRGQLGPHYFDCFVLTNNPDYRPKGIHKPQEPGLLYLRPAVDCVLVTDNLKYQPQLTEKPKLNLSEYLRRAVSLGASPKDGYLLWVHDSYGAWGWDDWPKVQSSQSATKRISLVVPRDSVLAGSLRLRSLRAKPIQLHVKHAALTDSTGRLTGKKIGWRVVGRIAPIWTSVPLLRRPYLIVPPYSTASIWLTFDVNGLEPGIYHSKITLNSAEGLPTQSVPVELQVAEFAAAPRQPILVGGYAVPYPGLAYKFDFKDHGVNLSRSPYSSDAERRRFGVDKVEYPLGEFGRKRDKQLREQFRHLLERMRMDQVGFDECLWKLGDEPSVFVDTWAYDGKVAKEMAPKTQVLYNPGPRAGMETFKALDPYVSVWEPAEKHFRFPDRVEFFSAKPYMWYTVHSEDELSATLPKSVYTQISSVPAKPGDCIGTKVYTFRRTERFPWDTAYQILPPHEGVFMYPTRHGPVPTRAWEAVRDASQHANLAMMLKEKAADLGLADHYAHLVATGTIEQLIKTLEELPSK